MDPKRRYAAGDIFTPSARQLNSWIEAAEKVDKKNAGKVIHPSHDPNRILIRNDTGMDLSHYRPILALGELLFDPSGANGELQSIMRPVFKGLAWDDPDADFNNFAICQSPVRKDASTEAIISGGSFVKVNVTDVTEQFHNYVRPTDEGLMELVGAGIAEVRRKTSGTGEQWAYVVLGEYSSPVMIGKTTTSHNKGFTEAVDLYGPATYATAKGSETSRSFSVQAYNRFADLGSGIWVFLEWVINGWELTNAEC